MKQTKIVCTISDQHCEQDFLRHLFFAGMNVVRMNTAHGTELFTNKQRGHLAEFLDLLLCQITFHSEQGTVNRQVYILRKTFYLTPHLAQRRTAFKDEFV